LFAPSLVPWETRYQEGQSQDWSGDFADARIGASKAKSVFVAYDPLFELDRKHVARLDQANLIPFKMPLVGHAIGMYMSEVGVLSAFVEGALAGTLTVQECNRLARNRRKTPRYFYCLGKRSRSVAVKEVCLRNIAKFQKIMPDYQRSFMDLMSSSSAWHLLRDIEFQKDLIGFDDDFLFAVLKLAADNSYLDHALEVSQLAIARRKVSPAMLVLIAECLWKLKRLQEAEAYGRLAIHSAPSYGNAYRILARILFSDKRATEARDVARVGVGVEGTSFLGWCDLARYNEAAGDFAGALMAAGLGKVRISGEILLG